MDDALKTPTVLIKYSFLFESWRYTHYSGIKELISSNASQAQGLVVKVDANADSDHAGDHITHRL